MLLTLKLNEYGIGLGSAIYASIARNIAAGGNWLSPTYTEFITRNLPNTRHYPFR
jgi:hypothetical protein